jgi:uncharacterized protein with GYD domain
MPRYVILINFTEQGLKAIKDLPKRVRSARGAVEKAGGKWLSWHMTMGDYDAVVIADLPDDFTASTILLAVGKSGNIRTTTLKAFTEDEMIKMIEILP